MVAHVAEDQGAGHNAPDGELAALRCEAEPLVAHLQHLRPIKDSKQSRRVRPQASTAQRQKSHKESAAELTSMSLKEPAVVRLS